ncbi:PF20097 family protein [Rubinisphaera sp.]|uniref:PF20097 family protein n=1 Tax=Rubinisphaera sp. TaxID=2024857 RepID=UPI000C0E7AFA|nr:PF20097 family protein [Rubinisphaera sp.]MBV09428.1 hypothetical protein [Rubinisphaera sp.]HCS55157.1 hypothetical protein [Planctomycetaceae bacterium]
MSAQPNCSDCNEPMELGFIPDASNMIVMQTQWHPGTPKDVKFLGFNPPTFMGKEVPAIYHDAEQMLPISAYRCSRCGILKFIANKIEN